MKDEKGGFVVLAYILYPMLVHARLFSSSYTNFGL